LRLRLLLLLLALTRIACRSSRALCQLLGRLLLEPPRTMP